MPDPNQNPNQGKPGDAPKTDAVPAKRSRAKPHLADDAMFRVVQPCAISCRPGDLVSRAQLCPPAAKGDDARPATDAVIERLIGLGAIVHEPQDEAEEPEPVKK